MTTEIILYIKTDIKDHTGKESDIKDHTGKESDIKGH